MIWSRLNSAYLPSGVNQFSAEEKSWDLIHYIEAYDDFGMQYTEYKAKTLMKYEVDKL